MDAQACLCLGAWPISTKTLCAGSYIGALQNIKPSYTEKIFFENVEYFFRK